MSSERRATGHLRLEERKSGRVWVAAIRFGAAGRSRKVLGPAWAKASKRRTERGGPVWRAADGPAPDDHLTPKQAEERLRELLDGLPRQQSSSESHNYGRTLGEAVDEWLRHREVEKRLKPTTMRYYRHLANHYVLPELGRGRSRAPVTAENIEALRAKGRTLALHKITIDDVDRMRRHLLERDLAPRTVAKAMVATFGVFERARRLRWIAANPAADAERVTFKTSRNIAVLDPEAVLAIAAACPVAWHAAAIRFSAFTGLRLGELRALRWRDIDYANQMVRVTGNVPAGMNAEGTTKGEHSRVVPLVDLAIEAIEPLSRRGRYTLPDDLVFPAPDGDFCTPDPMRRSLYAAMEDAGFGYLRQERAVRRPFVWHDLRHCFGTLAAQAFPLRDVQAYMGHQHISTTEIYLHHVPQADAAAKLNAVLAPRVGAEALLRGEMPVRPD